MTAERKRPTGLPPSAGVLARHAQAYARELGVAEGRVRAWVSYMILAGVLERAADTGAPRFIVKGGVALELRLRSRARATKDIDIVLRDMKADLALCRPFSAPARQQNRDEACRCLERALATVRPEIMPAFGLQNIQ